MLPEMEDDDDDVVVKLLEATLNGTLDFKIDSKEQKSQQNDNNNSSELNEDDELIDVRMTMESLLINDQSDDDDDDAKDKASISSDKSAGKKTVKFALGSRFVTALSIDRNGVPFDSLEPNQVINPKVSDEHDCDSVSLSNSTFSRSS